ncbi:MAG TPA: hypothetical protein VK192_12565 [Sphingomicrobium sp.]|nr:hypothetical protein [Sphingomicrobium sp.]
MSRTYDQYRPDRLLTRMSEERDHIAIQISLLRDAEKPDRVAIDALRVKLKDLEQRISKHRVA